jgi:branched-chain amino acid transport system permease protein
LVAQGLAIGLANGALYVLTALGLTLIYGILHIVNFAHGEIYMLGAMAVYVLYVVNKLPLWLTLVAIAALALALTREALLRVTEIDFAQAVDLETNAAMLAQLSGELTCGLAATRARVAKKKGQRT